MSGPPPLRWPDAPLSPALRAAVETRYADLADEWRRDWADLCAWEEAPDEKDIWIAGDAVLDGDGSGFIEFDDGLCFISVDAVTGGETWGLQSAALLAELDAVGDGSRCDLDKRILALAPHDDLIPWLTQPEAERWLDLFRFVALNRPPPAPYADTDMASADRELNRIIDAAQRRMLRGEPPPRPWKIKQRAGAP